MLLLRDELEADWVIVPIVRRCVDDLEVLQRAHADCWRGIEIKHEERGCDGYEGVWGKSCHAIGYCTHRMFAHPIVDVSATVVAVYSTVCL